MDIFIEQEIGITIDIIYISRACGMHILLVDGGDPIMAKELIQVVETLNTPTAMEIVITMIVTWNTIIQETIAYVVKER
jgi:hypothetical protein